MKWVTSNFLFGSGTSWSTWKFHPGILWNSRFVLGAAQGGAKVRSITFAGSLCLPPLHDLACSGQLREWAFIGSATAGQQRTLEFRGPEILDFNRRKVAYPTKCTRHSAFSEGASSWDLIADGNMMSLIWGNHFESLISWGNRVEQKICMPAGQQTYGLSLRAIGSRRL